MTKSRGESVGIAGHAESSPPQQPVAPGALSGLRVLELGGGTRSGYATLLLGDMGSEVIRVTASSIDTDGPALARGAAIALHRNKRWVQADISGDPESWAEALRWSDIVFVEDRSVLEDVQTLRRPDQVVVAITDFGLSGVRSSWRGSDLIAAAYGGGCQLNGDPGRAPLRPPADVGDHQVGVGAALAALLAWMVVERDGVGQLIDVSAVDTWATVETAVGMLEYIFQGRIAIRAGRRYPGRPYPYTVLRCKDGEVRLVCIQGREWKRTLEMLGSPEWGTNPRFSDRLENQKYADELDALIEDHLRHLTQAEVLKLAIKHGVPCVPIRDLADLVDDEQLREHGFLWKDAEFAVPGCPSHFSRTPASQRTPAARVPGLISELPLEVVERKPAKSRAIGKVALPLSGIRVVDFGWAWAGGALSSILADFGADVIKVESERRLDPMRMDRPLLEAGPTHEQGGLHQSVNRNKRSIAVDITSSRGAALVREIVGNCDVMIENLSPGTLERCGLGPDQLLASYPSLIHMSLSAVGGSGPLSGIRSYGPVITSLAGVDALMAYQGEKAVGLQHALADPNAAMHGALAIIAALLERRRSGCGQSITTSQLEAMVAIIGNHVVGHQIDPESSAPDGNRDPRMAPHGVFRAMGTDSWVAIVCPDDSAWKSLRDAMGNPGWAAVSELDTVSGRLMNVDLLEREIGRWTSSREPDEIARTVQEAGGFAAPLLDTGQRFADVHLQSRGDYTVVDHPVVGSEVVYSPPWKFADTPGAVRTPAPLLGQHTREVLVEVLGMSTEAIDELEDLGVLR